MFYAEIRNTMITIMNLRMKYDRCHTTIIITKRIMQYFLFAFKTHFNFIDRLCYYLLVDLVSKPVLSFYWYLFFSIHDNCSDKLEICNELFRNQCISRQSSLIIYYIGISFTTILFYDAEVKIRSLKLKCQ